VTLEGVIGQLQVVGRRLVGEQLPGEVGVVAGLLGQLLEVDGLVDQLLCDAHSLDMGVLDLALALDLALLLVGAGPVGRRWRSVVSAAEHDEELAEAGVGGGAKLYGELCGLGVLKRWSVYVYCEGSAIIYTLGWTGKVVWP
jgi:hypothetical protein